MKNKTVLITGGTGSWGHGLIHELLKEDACKDVGILYHLSALKHVPICEKMPYEAIETNVIGTKNVIDSAIENDVEKVIYIRKP